MKRSQKKLIRDYYIHGIYQNDEIKITKDNQVLIFYGTPLGNAWHFLGFGDDVLKQIASEKF